MNDHHGIHHGIPNRTPREFETRRRRVPSALLLLSHQSALVDRIEELNEVVDPEPDLSTSDDVAVGPRKCVAGLGGLRSELPNVGGARVV